MLFSFKLERDANCATEKMQNLKRAPNRETSVASPPARSPTFSIVLFCLGWERFAREQQRARERLPPRQATKTWFQFRGGATPQPKRRKCEREKAFSNAIQFRLRAVLLLQAWHRTEKAIRIPQPLVVRERNFWQLIVFPRSLLAIDSLDSVALSYQHEFRSIYSKYI